MNAIVAGIINTLTGEISDTVTHPSEKTKLRLKVRDELNVVHDKDTFMTFEFGIVGSNLDYIKRNMKTDDDDAMLPLFHLSRLHYLEVVEKEINQIQSSLNTANEAREECNQFLADKDAAKLNFVLDALDIEIDNIKSELDDANTKKSHVVRRINDLQKKIKS